MTHSDPNLARLLEWATMLDELSYYELLGLAEHADCGAIKQAWHDFAMAFHPDGHLDHGPDAQIAARRVFQRGAEAYRVLMDRQQRSKYDLAMAKGERRLEAPSDAPPPKSKSQVKTLEDLCRTAAAQMCARRADELISAGDLRAAQKELKMALYHDGNRNPDLEERLEALDLALFAMGD